MKKLSAKDFKNLNSKNGLLHILSNEEMNLDKTLRYIRYEERLADLQVELIKLQQLLIKPGKVKSTSNGSRPKNNKS